MNPKTILVGIEVGAKIIGLLRRIHLTEQTKAVHDEVSNIMEVIGDAIQKICNPPQKHEQPQIPAPDGTNAAL